MQSNEKVFNCDSFEENAEELCKTAVEKAIEADGENPEAYQLMASFQLSRQQTQVRHKKSIVFVAGGWMSFQIFPELLF